MAKPGEFRIERSVAMRVVSSRSSRHAVTFSPSSSRSRLHVIDSGQRYEVRLTGPGVAEISVDHGATWFPIQASVDSCSGVQLPERISYFRKRAGEPFQGGAAGGGFDMIAAGRGRLLAKEARTDLLYHLKLDELFRSRHVQGKGEPPCELSASDPYRKEDPPVPGNAIKLDPEFFVSGAPVVIPPELDRDYASHPASLRFPLFKIMVRNVLTDAISVPIKPRVWYLLDARSPLTIIDFDDLGEVLEEDLIAVATEGRILEVLMHQYEQVRDRAVSSIREWLVDVLTNPVTVAIGLVFVVGLGLAFAVAVAALGPPGAAVAGIAALALAAMLVAVVAAVAVGVWAVGALIIPWALGLAARFLRGRVVDLGFRALGLPLGLGLGFVLNRLFSSPDNIPSHAAIRGVPDAGGKIWLEFNVDKVLDTMADPALRNEPLERLAEAVLRRSRQRRFDGDASLPPPQSPNAPPHDLPAYEHVLYIKNEGADAGRAEPRFSIAYDKILDLGVGYSHWHEHWQVCYGGEMHNLLGTNPIAAKEHYNSIQYRLLNGPVQDGDGYNDGTTNFYILVRLGVSDEDIRELGADRLRIPKALRQRYAILWIDEQTYFTQRWRLLHPTRDFEGDLFALGRTLRESPHWFRFDLAKFWCPFEHECITDNSRMAVTRQIVAVTGFDPAMQQHEIYTICFSYGVSDHTWRWRPLPNGVRVHLLPDHSGDSPIGFHGTNENAIYVNTLGLREDATLHLRGHRASLAQVPLVECRWFQKYLPCDCRHSPRPHQLSPGLKPASGYSHAWDFISEAAYQRADRFFIFGVYEQFVDARCQYYEIEVLDNPDWLADHQIEQMVWMNATSDDMAPLRTDTYNYSWELGRRPSEYVPSKLLYDDRLRSRSMSMYEEVTRFRLCRRTPKGWIAVYYDKRDDELQSAAHLPHEVILVEDDAPVNDPFPTEAEERAVEIATSALSARGASGPARRAKGDEGSDGPSSGATRVHTPAGPHLTRPKSSSLRLLVKARRSVNRPPVVRKVLVTRVQQGGATRALRISFWTPLSVDDVYESVWAVRLGSLPVEGGVDILVDIDCATGFRRAGIPTSPLPLDYVNEVLTPEYAYEFEWSGLTPADQEKVDRYCTASGRIQYATSVWFEDVVGHKGTAEQIAFDRVDEP